MNHRKIIGALFLSVAASIWGGMFVVVKSVVGVIPPVELVWLRYLVAVIVLLVMMVVKRVRWQWDWRNGRLMLLIGLIGYALSIVTQETGTLLSSAQLGAVVTSATPAFMILFSWALLHVRPTRGDLISLVLASAGVILIVGLQFTGRRVLLGALCLVIAALTWALMSVLVRMVDAKYDGLQVTFVGTLVAFVTLTPSTIANWGSIAHVNFLQPHIWLSILYLGAISTALAFVIRNAGLRLLASNLSGLFFLFQPIVGALLGWLFLGETLTIGFALGTLLIFGSIWVALRLR
ncbi:DMT family transporter [Lacticaseibacillus songhuajiangensis]|uniref:DMT family transporter n=1 Tax=Lacticaseibacillus songhuajiangensis TaxID=1296539 RepID=UPI000F7B55F2|nr:DMT family transporter [Lacticaseibacillus songhuajiangensis]